MRVHGLSLSAFLLLVGLSGPVSAVKKEDFKTCSQSGFCRRGRALASRAREAESGAWASPYSLDPTSIRINENDASFTAGVRSALYPDIKFGLDVRIQEDGVVRVRMDEVEGLRKRYDEAARWALVNDIPGISKEIRWWSGQKDLKAQFEGGDVEVVVEYAPLRVVLKRGGVEQVVVNGRGLLHMEHFRNKEAIVEQEGEDQEVLAVKPTAWFEGDVQDAFWEESFSKWTDSKPKGPESLSLDIDFPNHGHVYGIPQHATSLSLPTTTGPEAKYDEPYRLYNADVFEYLADSTMSLYGSIPVMHAHSADSTVGVFHVVGSETWIDVGHPSEDSTETHWISESGILDLFILPGPTPADVFKQYAKLTGTAAMPAEWSLAYHQCRWNYVSSDDVRGVQKRFDEEDIPVDVFWLDIEYAEEHKYMIWDQKTFPDPVEMTNDVAAVGRKMVVIVDPHLKRTDSYPLYKKARDLGALVKRPDGKEDFEGWCWSGSAGWVDFFNPSSWDFWKRLFDYRVQPDGEWSWTQSTDDVHIWNDMNEPSIFNGPEITMQKDAVHFGGWEHRDVHNINGMSLVNLTAAGLTERGDKRLRPFVLTRSFYAGTQRYGAMWTGDNLGTWEHMAVGIKMCLANNIAGMVFAGSDVGGFFGNPEPEMLVRWYQVGAFTPFFRAHAHIDTKRREPYLLPEPYKSQLRDIIRLRYSLLPVWYTAFHENTLTGLPVMRPHYVVFPEDPRGFALDDQFFVGGSGLLVKPVTSPGVEETTVYLPEDETYYDYFRYRVYRGAVGGKNAVVSAKLDELPLFIRGGHIVPSRDRPRRSSTLMKHDPFTLRVALSKKGTAKGELYLDDGVTFEHQNGALVWREFTAAKTDDAWSTFTISSRDLASSSPSSLSTSLTTYTPSNPFTQSIADVKIEKIVVLGIPGFPPHAVRIGDRELEFEFKMGQACDVGNKGVASILTVKNPGVGVTEDWSIQVVPFVPEK